MRAIEVSDEVWEKIRELRRGVDEFRLATPLGIAPTGQPDWLATDEAFAQQVVEVGIYTMVEKHNESLAKLMVLKLMGGLSELGREEEAVGPGTPGTPHGVRNGAGFDCGDPACPGHDQERRARGGVGVGEKGN